MQGSGTQEGQTGRSRSRTFHTDGKAECKKSTVAGGTVFIFCIVFFFFYYPVLLNFVVKNIVPSNVLLTDFFAENTQVVISSHPFSLSLFLFFSLSSFLTLFLCFHYFSVVSFHRLSVTFFLISLSSLLIHWFPHSVISWFAPYFTLINSFSSFSHFFLSFQTC